MSIRFLCCVVFIVTTAAGQSFQDASNKYYIGRGEHVLLETARSRALDNLVEQIEVLVSSTLQSTVSENASTYTDTTYRSTRSSSLITLRDVQETVDQGQGVYRVVKFVPRAVVQSIFEQRRRQILDYLQAAEAEEAATAAVDISRMLGYYYKAWLITGLYPDTLSYSFRLGGASGVVAGIPRAMQAVCDKLTFSPLKKIDDENTTWKYSVQWSGRPANNLRYTFHDGLGESEEEAKNGGVQMTFFFADKRERLFPVSIHYRETNIQDALLAAVDSIRAPFAPKLTMQVLLPGEKQLTAAKPGVPATLPAKLRPLAEHRTDLAFIWSELSRLIRLGDIVAGNKNDFETLDGLYVIVLGTDSLEAILSYDRGAYADTATGGLVQLSDFAGRKIRWIKVQ